MAVTAVHVKVLAIILRDEEVAASSIAEEIGFRDPGNLAPHLGYFVRMGCIRALPGGRYRLNRRRDVLLTLYEQRHYRALQNRIREIPWLVEEMTAGFSGLEPDLLALIRRMMVASHSFFSVVARHPSHQAVLSVYRLYLFPCDLLGLEDAVVQAWYLYGQIYTESVVRDIEGGGLGEDFLLPLDEIRSRLKGLVWAPT